MNTSGEAADQVVRMVLEGTEYVVRLSGKGAVQLGALVYSIARQQKKTKGAERLTNMYQTMKWIQSAPCINWYPLPKASIMTKLNG